jgi:hypothetical protein
MSSADVRCKPGVSLGFLASYTASTEECATRLRDKLREEVEEFIASCTTTRVRS